MFPSGFVAHGAANELNLPEKFPASRAILQKP
jgi:hypothetical protein